jgi:hypothetical protein
VCFSGFFFWGSSPPPTGFVLFHFLGPRFSRSALRALLLLTAKPAVLYVS